MDDDLDLTELFGGIGEIIGEGINALDGVRVNILENSRNVIKSNRKKKPTVVNPEAKIAESSEINDCSEVGMSKSNDDLPLNSFQTPSNEHQRRKSNFFKRDKKPKSDNNQQNRCGCTIM